MIDVNTFTEVEANNSLIFVDSQVNNGHSLIATITGAEIIVLDRFQDGIEQITKALSDRQNIAQVEVISHAQSGLIQLGSTQLGWENLDQYSEAIASWSNSLTEEADLKLYGCNLAGDRQGIKLVERLSQLSGADIAASEDITGSAALGGDWELEVTTGEVAADSAFTVNPNYTDILPLYQGHEYVLTDVGSWTEAQIEAESLGGNLVTINDPAEEAWLKSVFGDDGFWIGINDADVEGEFEWVSGEPVTYTNWAPGEPNNDWGVQDYGWMNYGPTDQWDDAWPDMFMRGIVEINNSLGEPGVIGIEDSTILVNEGDRTAEVTVVRTLGSSGTVTVDYRTIADTAKSASDNTRSGVLSGSDYRSRSGTLSFAPGEVSKTITIPIVDDNLIENNEFFSLAIDNVSGGATLLAPRTAQVRIVDNDRLSFNSFANGSNLSLNGSASIVDQQLRLTPDQPDQAGSAFYQQAIALDNNSSFRTQFQIQLTGDNGSQGGDGLAFIIQDRADGVNTLGSAAGELGYGGSGSNSIAVEFDTNKNAYDLNDNHLSLLQDAKVNEAIVTTTSPLDLNSGSPVYVWVDYNGATDELQVFIDPTMVKPATPVLEATVDLASAVGETAYLGFSAATGELTNAHNLNSWMLNTEMPVMSEGTGLKGEYYNNIDFTNLGLARTDATIDFDWGRDSPDSTIDDDTFSVRWSGQIEPRYSETYTFRTLTNDGVRLKVDNRLIVDQYVNQPATSSTGTITLAAGQKYNIELEYYENRKDAVAKLFWSSASQAEEIVPQSQLYPASSSSNLTTETLISGLNQPIAIDWTPSGQTMFVAQKGGIVKVWQDGAIADTPFIDISAKVNKANDRGLLDIAVHPDFPDTPYLYLLYTYDPPEVFNFSDDPLAKPDGSGNRAARLTRVTADAKTNYTTAIAGSEVVILGTNSTWDNFNGFVNSTTNFDEPPAGILANGANLRDFLAADSDSHTIGSVEFGPDGNLYVSNGDGASYNRVDPRAVRVQDINNLSGKILRIDPITGEGLVDNPFYDGDPNSNRSKVYQSGLRNPFRITVDPETGQVYTGDVGWTRWEEINRAAPGANFGWPYYEGGSGNNLRANKYQDLPEAQAFYASDETATPSIYALNHAATGINAIVLGDLYTGSVYPQEYRGDLFVNDLGQGIVRNLSFDDNGNITSVETFTTGAATVVQIVTSPDGYLYYVDLDDGLIGRWLFV